MRDIIFFGVGAMLAAALWVSESPNIDVKVSPEIEHAAVRMLQAERR